MSIARHKLAVLADHCLAVGRDRGSIRKAMPWTVYLHRDGAVAKRLAGDALQAERPPFAGDPAAFRDRIHEAIDLGFDMVQLRFAGMLGTEDLELFADEVLPHFR